MTLEASTNQTPHGFAQQHRRRVGCAAKGRIRLDLRRSYSCRASAETNNQSTPLPAPSPSIRRGQVRDGKAPNAESAPSGTEAAPQQSADAAQPSAPPPTADPRLASAVRVMVGGAVAMAALAVGYEFGAHLISTLESVPPLAHLELVVGTLVSARALSLYLGDPQARSAVDGSVELAVEGVKGAIGLPAITTVPDIVEAQDIIQEAVNNARIAPLAASSPTLPHLSLPPSPAMKPAPTMLEVEIRSLVDQAMAAALDTPEPSVVTVDRRALVDAVTEYIRRREQHTREGLEKVREELEASETLKQSLVQLTKTREARRARREAETAAVARLQRLQEEHSRLLADGSATESVAEEMAGIQRSLERMSLGSEDSESAAAAESTQEKGTEEDGLEEAVERARKFRAKLDAMKEARQKRAKDDRKE